MSQKQNISVPIWAYIAFLISLTSLAVLLAVMPYFSMPILIAGVIMVCVSVIPSVVMLLTGKRNWWVGVITVTGITSYFWGFAVRNFVLIIPGQIIWEILVAISFLIALLLPVINPSASKFLWREQTEPETVFGKKLLGILLLIAPVAGTLGASVRFIRGEVSGYPVAFFIFGISSWFLAVLMTFTFSSQLWEQRPWKNKKTGRHK